MKNKIFSILVFIATLFMGVGYASINSISLNVSGEMVAQVQDGIFITDVNYNEELSSNVIVSDSKINSAHQTNFDSSIVLTASDDSQITYDITIFNSKPYACYFDGVEYNVGSYTYDNLNIVFKLTNLDNGYVLSSDSSKTFSITFYYSDTSSISNSVLNSILNFKFSAVPVVVGSYDYSGNVEELVIPYTGVYKLEVWGAQGGKANTSVGGYGSYSVGSIKLNSGETLSVVVGGKGGDCTAYSFCSTGGYNGGGSACGNHDTYFSSGGGATHIAKKTGLLSTLSSNVDSVLIVAGGGGGAGYYTGTSSSYYGKNNKGGNAGGYAGANGGGPSYGKGGTQTAGGAGNTTGNPVSGKFGLGGGGSSNIASGGGAGFYGGGTGFDFGSAAGGGSGYVGNTSLYDKYMVCYSCSTSSVESTKTVSVTNVSDSPVVDYAKSGNGYAKITFISE